MVAAHYPRAATEFHFTLFAPNPQDADIIESGAAFAKHGDIGEAAIDQLFRWE
jgi:hypothetical protein